jgi:O-antigen ligase
MFFLKIPVLIFVALALCAGGSYLLFVRTGRIDRIGALVLVNYALWVGSALAVGSVSVRDLLTPGYYPEEGRIFLYYFPVLLFSVVSADVSVLRRAIQAMGAITIAVFGLLLVWSVAPLAVLSIGANFVGLLTSHTGAGIFFGFLAVFQGLHGIEQRNGRSLALAVLALFAVFASGSREALVGLAVVACWYLLQRGSWRSVPVAGAAGAVFLLLMSVFTPHTFGKVERMVDPATFRAVFAVVRRAHWEPGAERDFSGEDADPNILSRILFWTYAAKLFVSSPIVGVGFGRYNDHNIQRVGFEGLVYPAVEGGKNLTAGQPHNSYIQMLAETGVIGLGLLLAVWGTLYLRLQRARAWYAEDPEMAGYFLACQGLIIFTMMDANFGHALGSPSLGIPVLAVVGAGVATFRDARKRAAAAAPAPVPA